METETRLFWAYILSSCVYIVSLITCSLPWSYWAYTINTCPGFNCECILFGKSYSDQFSGGKAIYCQLVTFLQIPLFLTAAVLSFYQGRQALIVRRVRRRLKYRNAESEKNPVLILKTRNGQTLKEGDVFVEEKVVEMEPPTQKTSIIFLVVSCLCQIIALGIFILFVTGFYRMEKSGWSIDWQVFMTDVTLKWTETFPCHILADYDQRSCGEYRKMLVKLLKASGNMAEILSERLECTAIFDFVDYLQPKRRMNDPADYGRTTKIHTGLSLLVAQVALLKNVFLWGVISFFHIKLLRRRRRFDRKMFEGEIDVDTKRFPLKNEIPTELD